MRVLVTGATGFVGRATVARFAARGDEVLAVARPTSASQIDRKLARLVVADLPDLSPLDSAPRPDVIVHAAAEIFPHGPDAERRSHAVHVDATRALAERAKRHGAIFIHLSTTDVYVEETSATIIDEDSPTGPSALYGRTKLEGELCLRESHPEAIIFRPPGIYGPGSRADYVQEVVRKVARGRFFFVGDGRPRRSWVFVENLVDAIVRAADGRVPPGTFLVDDGAPVERRELVRSVARALQAPMPVLRMPIPLARAIARSLERTCPRLGVTPPLTMRGVRFLSEGLALDTRRLRETGFVPSWRFDDAVVETVRWVCRR